jgi:hypothetical protein
MQELSGRSCHERGIKMYYVLNDNNEPVVERDTNKFCKWIENNDNRRIAYTKVGSKAVSTVFLGIDHGFDGGPPVLFETMVFGGKFNEYMKRYSTYNGALEGHDETVLLVKSVDKRNRENENKAL